MRSAEYFHNFLSFLRRVNDKTPREDINPSFGFKDVNISIVFVGRHEVVNRFSHYPYVSFIREASKKGVRIFYILARGRINSEIAQYVVGELEKENIVKTSDDYSDEEPYKGKRVKITCIRLESTQEEFGSLEEYFPTLQNAR
jgi:hypothetical protein